MTEISQLYESSKRHATKEVKDFLFRTLFKSKRNKSKFKKKIKSKRNSLSVFLTLLNYQL